ncbi:MAG: hypothetical protein ACFFDP_04540 [Promethearchaeota archaeon]
MPVGIVLLEFDAKMGPIYKFSIPPDLRLDSDETMVLFTTRTLVNEGYSAITVKDRTWATYVLPPNLFALLLSPEEHSSTFEAPMAKIIQNLASKNDINPEILTEIYDLIVQQTGKQDREKILSLPEVQEIMKLVSNSQEPIRPIWSADDGYRYPDAEKFTGKSPKETSELLTSMMNAGLLKGRICGNIANCPRCGAHGIVLHAICPKCGLSTLESGIGLEHFVCDYTGFINEFSSSEGMVCPNCKISLKPDTYRNLGTIFHCVTCGSYPQIPEYMMGCLQCKETFLPKQAKYRSIYCFSSAKDTS